LLDRQASLIHHLTSGAAIFDDAERQPVDPALRGIDRRLLGIEARFSFEKRMDKIVSVFPRTFDLLGASQKTLLREFAAACPPQTIGRLENARQFHEFLSARWALQRPVPPYLPDMAACELAVATSRALAEDRPGHQENSRAVTLRACIRRSPAVVLLRIAYDVRPWFENASQAGIPVARQVPLAIVAQAGGDHPKIFELPPAIFDLIDSIEDWVDEDTFEQWEADKLIDELASAGLIEVGP